MVLIQVVVGFLFLISGRRLFWVFVACLGAATGMLVVGSVIDGDDVFLAAAVVLLFGLLGAGVAVVFQKASIGVAGFLAGGWLAVGFPSALGAAPPHALWVFYLAGGVLGLILASLFFEWALIVLSSLLGASLIIQAAGLPALEAMAILLVLALSGTILQTRRMLVEA